MPEVDTERAKYFAHVEYDVQRIDFDLVAEGLKSIPSRAGPILGAALVIATFLADYLYKLNGSKAPLWAVAVCGIFGALSLGWSLIFASLALARVNVDEPAPLPAPTSEDIQRVQATETESEGDEPAEAAVSAADVLHIKARVTASAMDKPSQLGSEADALIAQAEALSKWNTSMTVKLDEARGYMIYSFSGLIALLLVVFVTFGLRTHFIVEPDSNALPKSVETLARSATASSGAAVSIAESAKQSADSISNKIKVQSVNLKDVGESLRSLAKDLGKMSP